GPIVEVRSIEAAKALDAPAFELGTDRRIERDIRARHLVPHRAKKPGQRPHSAPRHADAMDSHDDSLLVSPDDVEAEWGLDDGAHLPHFESERRIGERLYHHVAREAAEIAVLPRSAGLVRVRRHDLVEVLPLLDEIERFVRSQTRFVLAARDALRSVFRALV